MPPGHRPRSHEFSAWGPEKEVSIYLHLSLDLTLIILYNVFFFFGIYLVDSGC